MARTNRKAALAAAQPPAASVETLDDLDLDGMFNEGDNLFDGLDIDLDGMQDISTTKKKGNAPMNMPSEPPVVPITEEGPKRRTTKRKIKAPAQLADFDQEDEELPKRKRRASKASAKKAKSAKAASKASASVVMPPPFARGAVDPNSTVAVAPQNSKNGLARQTSSSSIMSSGSNLSTSSTGHVPPVGGPKSTYCGLRPSSTNFFPFMDAIPQESTLKKTQFPLMSGLHNAITTTSAAPVSQNPAKETDGIYRLISADLDQMYNDRNTSQAATDQRRANLGHVISSARTTLQSADRKKLLKTLYELCFLLKRQYEFFNQNDSNMERWCRENYSLADYQLAYGTVPTGTHKQGMASTPGMAPQCTLFASLKSPIIKVKVKCSGFKPPKPFLIAHVKLTRSTTASSSTRSDSSRVTKKRKLADTDRTSISSFTFEDIVVKEPSYVDMKPIQRRRQVAEAVAQKSQNLELQIKEAREKHRRTIERQCAEQQKIVDDDEIVSVNTMTMWKWLEKSPHFADYTEGDLRQVLEYLWEPEIVDADILTRPAEIALLQPPKRHPHSNSNSSPVDSIFIRLQTLLVDEESGDDDEEDQDEDYVWMAEDSDDTIQENSKGSAMLDLSKFSLEERTLIHLRAAGLIDDIHPFVTQPSFVDDSGRLSFKESIDQKDPSSHTRMETIKIEESDIDDVILSMQAELLNQRRENNARIGFLESTALSHIESSRELKKMEEECALIVSKYNQTLKKQKETKKGTRSRPSSSNDDGAWMPW
jgi:hypothetical protein